MDMNDRGEMYRLTIESDAIFNCMEYLKTLSKDVRLVGEKSVRGKRDNGDRKIPYGIIRNCVYKYDKIRSVRSRKVGCEFKNEVSA